MSLEDEDLSAATDHHRKVETVPPSVLDLSLNVLEGPRSISSNRSSSQSRNSSSFSSRPVPKCPWRTRIYQQQQIIIAKLKQFLFPFSTCASICLKDSHLFTARDHHRKVETVPPSVLDLSLNVLEGRRSISSNKSSSQSRNSFSFASRPVHQFLWRTHICLQQRIIITKYK